MRSLRAFVISFVLSLTIFGVLAYNIVGNVFDIRFTVPTISEITTDTEGGVPDNNLTKPTKPDKNQDGDKKGESGENGEEDEETEPTISVGDIELPKGKENEATFLFVQTDYQPSVFNYDKSGYDENGLYVKKKKISVESLLLVKIDRESQTFMFSSIPGNTVVTKATNKTVGDLYSEKGAGYMVDCVYALTGIQVEYLSVIGIDDSLKLFKKIGKLTFDIPCNMSYVDEERKLNIDLKAGLQNMTPEMVLHMLLFDAYSEDYIYTRESVHVDLAQALFAKLTSPAYFSKAVETYRSLFAFFETNFDEKDFNDNIDLLFSYQHYQSLVVTYPGYDNELEDRIVFMPSIGEALSAYEEFK